MCGTMTMIARQTAVSYVTTGTLEQRLHLAELMEKGLNRTGVEEDIAIEGSHPLLEHSGKRNDPVLAAGIALAIMGLDDDPLMSRIIYIDAYERHRLTCREFGTNLPPITAAAEMLGLPFDLLRETQDLCVSGLHARGVIAELRK